jgi:hypothetical protein
LVDTTFEENLLGGHQNGFPGLGCLGFRSSHDFSQVDAG